MIRVAIIADTLSHAQSIATLLSDDDRLEPIDVRAETNTSSGEHSLEADVILYAGLPLVRIPDNSLPTVVVTDERVDPGFPQRSIHAYLTPSATASELAAAITAAASDLYVLTHQQANRLVRAQTPTRAPATEEDATPFLEHLTARERQVLNMLAGGLGNKEIAGRLNISDHTAKFHVAQILAKLGATSRTEAVTIGIRRGLVAI